MSRIDDEGCIYISSSDSDSDLDSKENNKDDNDNGNDSDFMPKRKKYKFDEKVRKKEIKNRGNVKETQYPIGIDLGTTNSCIGIWDEDIKGSDKVVIIQNALSQYMEPSFVKIENGIPYVGKVAQETVLQNVKHTFYGIKRIIGKRYVILFINKHTFYIYYVYIILYPFLLINFNKIYNILCYIL